MERTVRTADGRTLAVRESGDVSGRPVLVQMGTPNSRLLYAPNVTDAAARGLRLISYDRPGYGGSSPHPGRKVADCAGDVRAICDALEIGRLGMWGISGGGPHVLACAALLPDLVAAAAVLATPAPYGADGLDWFAGMGDDNAEDFRLLLADPDAARAKTDHDRKVFLTSSPSELAQALKSLLSPVDANAMSDGIALFLAAVNQAGLAPGSEGWWEDSCAEAAPWGFDLADISVPVLLMHGKQDNFVPTGHGQWLAEHIPAVEAKMLPDDGHLTLIAHRVPEVHAWLADRI